MKKTIKNIKKDTDKKSEEIWIDEHTPFKKRRCGSGVIFSGKYVNKN